MNLNHTILQIFGKTNVSEETMFRSSNIYVYYNEIEYTVMSQIPKTSQADLVANLGGTLGNLFRLNKRNINLSLTILCSL